MPTFGKTNIGGTVNNFPGTGGGISGSIFALAEYGAIESASVYFQGDAANHDAGLAKVLIYTVKANGEPGGLVAESEELTLPDSVVGWQTFRFITPVLLMPASYCLCIFANARMQGTMDVAGTNYFRAQTYTDGVADPFGSPTSSTNQKSIYVTYAQAEPRVTVVTWNVAGTSNSTAVAAFLKSFAPLADVICLQEVNTSQAGQYETALEAAYGVAMDRLHAPDCDTYTGGTCTVDRADGQFIISRWTGGTTETTLYPFDDEFGVDARRLTRMTVTIAGRTMNFFDVHGPAGSEATSITSKMGFVHAINAYAKTFPGLSILAGDFNNHAQPPLHKVTGEAIKQLLIDWEDSWRQVGTGTGTTRTTSEDRIDLILYGDGLYPVRSSVGASGAISDHYPVMSEFGFTFPAGKTTKPGKFTRTFGSFNSQR